MRSNHFRSNKFTADGGRPTVCPTPKTRSRAQPNAIFARLAASVAELVREFIQALHRFDNVLLSRSRIDRAQAQRNNAAQSGRGQQGVAIWAGERISQPLRARSSRSASSASSNPRVIA